MFWFFLEGPWFCLLSILCLFYWLITFKEIIFHCSLMFIPLLHIQTELYIRVIAPISSKNLMSFLLSFPPFFPPFPLSSTSCNPVFHHPISLRYEMLFPPPDSTFEFFFYLKDLLGEPYNKLKFRKHSQLWSASQFSKCCHNLIWFSFRPRIVGSDSGVRQLTKPDLESRPPGILVASHSNCPCLYRIPKRSWSLETRINQFRAAL